MSIIDWLLWPTNTTHIVLSTDYYNNPKPILRVGTQTDEIFDFDLNGYSPGQGSCAVNFFDRLLMLGGRHNKKAIARLHSCHIQTMLQELPDIMAFQSCTVSSDAMSVIICGNYYDTDPTCYEMDSSYTFTQIADTTELHRMGAMSLYQGDPVISGGVYTNGVERLVSGTWSSAMADIPNGGYLYGHTQVTMCCDPAFGSAIDRIWIFGGIEGTTPLVDAAPTAKTWHYSDDATWVQGPDMLTPRHSHTSFYIPLLDMVTMTAYRKFRHVGGNGTLMIEDWTFETDSMNIVNFGTLIQEELNYAELDEYSYPTVFGVDDVYGDTCSENQIICTLC